ncbi:MAG: YbaB/EbfC family nucleoid-associated protein [Eubacteriales bacterium]
MKRKPMGGGFGNMNNMLKQAQKMQAEVTRVQDEISKREFEVTAGGGAIQVKLMGTKELVSIKLNPDIVDKDNIEDLEDMIVAAVNQGLQQIEDFGNEEMKKVTGGISIPGLF